MTISKSVSSSSFFLISEPNLNEPIGPNGETALIQACQGENEPEVLRLIKAGADVTIPARNGNTPLHCISKLGSKTLLQPILEKMTPVQKKILLEKPIGTKQMTPLMLAVFHRHIKFAKLLITEGASVDNAKFCFDALVKQNLIDPGSCKKAIETLNVIRLEAIDLSREIKVPTKWKKYCFECTPCIVKATSTNDKLSTASLKVIHNFRETAILNSLHAIGDTLKQFNNMFEKIAKSMKFQIKQGVDIISTKFQVAFLLPEGEGQAIIKKFEDAVERSKKDPKIEGKNWSENDEFFRVSALPIKDDFDFLSADIIVTMAPNKFDTAYLQSIFSKITVDGRSWTPLIAFLTPDTHAPDKFREQCVYSTLGDSLNFQPPVHPSLRLRYWQEMLKNSICIQASAPLSNDLNRIDRFLDRIMCARSKSRLEPLLMVLKELEFILNKNYDLEAITPLLEIVKNNLIIPDSLENAIERMFEPNRGPRPLQINEGTVLDGAINMSLEANEWAKKTSWKIMEEVGDSKYYKLAPLVELNLMRLFENVKEFLEFESISRLRQATSEFVNELKLSKIAHEPDFIKDSTLVKDFRDNVQEIINRMTTRLTELFDCAADIRIKRAADNAKYKPILEDVRNAIVKLVERSVVEPSNVHLPKDPSNNKPFIFDFNLEVPVEPNHKSLHV